jgi:hypothetical protein
LCYDRIEIILESDSDMYSEGENELLQDTAGPPTNSRNMKKSKKSSINRKDDNNNHKQ